MHARDLVLQFNPDKYQGVALPACALIVAALRASRPPLRPTRDRLKLGGTTCLTLLV